LARPQKLQEKGPARKGVSGKGVVSFLKSEKKKKHKGREDWSRKRDRYRGGTGENAHARKR